MAARLGAGKARTGATQTGGDGRPIPPSDNRRAREEADQAQYLSAIYKVRSKDVEITRAMATVSALRAERKEIMDLAVAAGFKKYEIEDDLKDLTAPKVNHVDKEDRRARRRTWLGLPVGPRQTDDLPLEARDELDWESEGYRAGIRADEPRPPSECPQRFTQAWLKGYHNGQERNAKALAFKPEPVLTPAPAAPETEKEPTRAELKAQEARVREGLEKLGKGGETALDAIREAEPELVDQVVGEHGDGFEASAEELAAQAGRPQHDEESV